MHGINWPDMTQIVNKSISKQSLFKLDYCKIYIYQSHRLFLAEHCSSNCAGYVDAWRPHLPIVAVAQVWVVLKTRAWCCCRDCRLFPIVIGFFVTHIRVHSLPQNARYESPVRTHLTRNIRQTGLMIDWHHSQTPANLSGLLRLSNNTWNTPHCSLHTM